LSKEDIGDYGALSTGCIVVLDGMVNRSDNELKTAA